MTRPLDLDRYQAMIKALQAAEYTVAQGRFETSKVGHDAVLACHAFFQIDALYDLAGTINAALEPEPASNWQPWADVERRFQSLR